MTSFKLNPNSLDLPAGTRADKEPRTWLQQIAEPRSKPPGRADRTKEGLDKVPSDGLTCATFLRFFEIASRENFFRTPNSHGINLIISDTWYHL